MSYRELPYSISMSALYAAYVVLYPLINIGQQEWKPKCMKLDRYSDRNPNMLIHNCNADSTVFVSCERAKISR